MADCSDRRDARVLISEGAVLTVTRAAEVLGFKGAEQWLREQGLVSTIGFGRRTIERVVWRTVLERLEECAQKEKQEKTPQPTRKVGRYRLADV